MQEEKSCQELSQEILDKEYANFGYDIQKIIKDLADDVAQRIINDRKQLEGAREEYEAKNG